MSVTQRIVIATPYDRYNDLERTLGNRRGFKLLRLRSVDELQIDALASFKPSHVFFPHWSWSIPLDVLTQFECVVFHMTDLPFGRGGSPLQNLIVRGIETTQLSALRCEETLDSGPIYLKEPLSTLGTAEEVFLRAAALMEGMIVRIVEDRLQPVAQTGEPTLFQRRRPSQSNLSQAQTLREVHDLIRMLDADGYPQAYVEIDSFRLTFTRASLRAGHVVADVHIEMRNAGGEA